MGAAEVEIRSAAPGTGVPEEVETAVIGGGLCGLSAAGLLARQGVAVVLLEARERLGGRILCGEHEGLGVDLGPSWFWPAINPRVARLAADLGLHGYRQYEQGRGRVQGPDGAPHTVRGFAPEPPSWRLAGGMATLVAGLVEALPADRICCGSPVCRLARCADGVEVEIGELEATPTHRVRARQVVLALPPRLAAATILFTPDLPDDLTQAMLGIPTWMAGQAKLCAVYAEPGWRSAGLSGQAFSHRGPLAEIHDGSNAGRGPYGLTGFVGVPAVQRRAMPRLEAAVLEQLAEIFGPSAAQPVAVFYQDWARERFTATRYDQPPLYEHPVYGPPAGRTAIWDGRIQLAGTETAAAYGGYLEGALAAAERAVQGCRAAAGG